MRVVLERFYAEADSTLGLLSLIGSKPGPQPLLTLFVLEDAMREPAAAPGTIRDDKWVKAWKIKTKTAIPCGRYRLAWTWSNRFDRMMLEVLDVPGFTGIRIHSGHDADDTAGCLLVGRKHKGSEIFESKIALGLLETHLVVHDKLVEPSWLEVTNNFNKLVGQHDSV